MQNHRITQGRGRPGCRQTPWPAGGKRHAVAVVTGIPGLGARPKASNHRLSKAARTVKRWSMPRTPHRIPNCLRRWLTTVLEPASKPPTQWNSPLGQRFAKAVARPCGASRDRSRPSRGVARTAQGLSRAAGVGVFAGVMNEDDGQLELALEFAQKVSSAAIWVVSFSSTQWRRINGSRMSRRGRSCWTVSARRARSVGVSNRSEGAVMTSTGSEAKETCAAAAIPSSRWRTTASESSAGKRSTGPERRTGNWCKQAAP